MDLVDLVKGSGVVNKAEIDVFVELSCFFDDPMDVGNLISGSVIPCANFFPSLVYISEEATLNSSVSLLFIFKCLYNIL